MAEPPVTAQSVYDTVPLPRGKTMCIRVIKIRPTTCDHFDLIVCDFDILDITRGTLVEPSQQPHNDENTSPPAPERVNYKSLSYTWGSPSGGSRVIRLGGTAFRVRKNLWDFLHRARKRGLTGYLWIDAICIDQATVGERNHQVSMMGDIYSKAQCVIVWLGDCSDEKCDLLADVFSGHKKHRPTWVEAPQQAALNGFMHSPYWSRAWIVQEYHLARRKVIWYGNFEPTPECLWNMFNCAHVCVTRARLLCDIEHILQPTSKLRDATPLATFYELFRLFQSLKCADKRDRIFSLLPLLTPEERAQLGVRPDYSKSATCLFEDVIQGLKAIQEKSPSSDSSEYLWCVVSLYDMLAPDSQHPSVQLAILKLLEIHTGMDSIQFIGHVDHQCGDRAESAPLIGINGCPVCHQKPTVTFDWGRRAEGKNRKFSWNNWQTYVQALLASGDGEKRYLGMQYCRARSLRLGVGGTLWKVGTEVSVKRSREDDDCIEERHASKRWRGG